MKSVLHKCYDDFGNLKDNALNIAFNLGKKEGLRKGKKQGRADAERDFQNSDYWNDYLAKVIADARADAIEEYRQRLNNAFEPVEEHEQMELEVVIADVNRLAKVLKEQENV